MKLEKIIAIVDNAYPDGMIQQAFDAFNRYQELPGEDRVGDGLAEFIVRELADTYDPKAPKKDQLAEAVRVMSKFGYILKPKRNYTVFGIYGDNSQPWMTYVADVVSPRTAARRGILITYDKGKNGVELEDILVIEVVEGYVKGVLGNDAVMGMKDLKGK